MVVVCTKFDLGDLVSYKTKDTEVGYYTSKVLSIKIKVRSNGNHKIQYKLLSKDGYMNYRNENDLFIIR